MQIRELALTELDTAYEVVKELRTQLSYDEFEDLVYDMRHQEYKMYGIFQRGELITYAGVCVQVNLYWKRHLYVHELVTTASHRGQGFGKEMLLYLHDIARMFQCEKIALTSGHQRKDAHRFYEREGFASVSEAFVKPV
ncbi:MAG: GNAT family N-acetyltransferase [Sulfurimonadaceae bacterium]|nr:GNAT family N-acetyltransferase [Sulfurimonadaceae bacterium]